MVGDVEGSVITRGVFVVDQHDVSALLAEQYVAA
jgi:hypothetical protein